MLALAAVAAALSLCIHVSHAALMGRSSTTVPQTDDYAILSTRLQASRAIKPTPSSSLPFITQFMTSIRNLDKDAVLSSKTIRVLGVGVGIYIGARIASYIDSILFRKHKSNISSSLASMNEFNKNLLDEIRRDQEELWRVAHTLHQGHAERMELLGNSTNEKISALESSLLELSDELTSKLQELASTSSVREDDGELIQKIASIEQRVSQLAKGIERNKINIKTLRENIPKLLSNHDSKVLVRLKAFSQEVKEVLRRKK